MGIIRPATPGFLVTLVATGLLAAVTFSVPYIKSVYFLKASISVDNVNSTFTFGTLGYCIQLSNGTTCSKPSVGYELDVNSLLGDDTRIQIPNVLVKWITYALVLHIVALILSAISAVFGLLAHVREMSMAYCSSFISGFAATVTLVAFIFDIVLFYVTKSRVNNESGGSSSLGLAVWLTLASWLLLFFAGCFYTIGRCCIRRRPTGSGWGRDRNGVPENSYAEQMRLDAVKAEADRKARQKQGEIGLPAFQELDQLQPLTRHADEQEYVEDGDKVVPLSDAQNTGSYGRRQPSQNRPYPGGYVPQPAGTRAVDYSNASPATSTVYPPQTPPQARRQGSGHTQGTSGYAPSTYSNSPGVAGVGAAAAAAGAGGYLAAGGYGHTQQASGATQNYGHGQGGSYYQSSHQQYPSNYSALHDAAYATPQPQAFSPDTYNSTAYIGGMPTTSSPPPAGAANAYYSSRSPPIPQHDGYSNAAQNTGYFDPYAAAGTSHYTSHSPPPVNTQVAAGHPVRSPTQTSQSPMGMPQAHGHEPSYSDSPPMYDAATAQPPGMWSTKPSGR